MPSKCFSSGNKMTYLLSSPNFNNLGGMLTKHYPRRGILLFKLLEDIKSSFSSLSIDTCESIITYTCGLNHYDTHQARFKKPGSVEADLLKPDFNSINFDEKLNPILNFVNKLTLTPDQITQADVQSIFDAGWDEQAFLDSVYLCAISNCMNCFITGLGIKAENQINQ
jgi:hypothetical protein